MRKYSKACMHYVSQVPAMRLQAKEWLPHLQASRLYRCKRSQAYLLTHSLGRETQVAYAFSSFNAFGSKKKEKKDSRISSNDS